MLFHAELIDGRCVVFLTWKECSGGELRMVGAVGIVLGLEAEGAASGIGDAFLADEAAVEEVASVELHTWLIGIHVHLDAAGGVVEGACHSVDVAIGSQDPVVVVSVAVLNLHVGGVVDAVANAGGGAEVEGSAFDVSNLACCQHVLVDGSVLVGVQVQHFVESILGGVAAQAEVAMVGQVEDGGLVGTALIGDGQGVVVAQLVGDLHADVARIAILAVRTCGGELEGLVVHLIGFPDAVVEGNGAASVETVHVVVGNQLILLSVEGELGISNAVAIASDEGSEVASFVAELDVVVDVVVSQADIDELAVLVGHHDADDASSEVCEADLHAVGVGQGVEIRLFRLEIAAEKSGLCGLLGFLFGFGLAGCEHPQACCCNQETAGKKLFHFLFVFLIRVNYNVNSIKSASQISSFRQKYHFFHRPQTFFSQFADKMCAHIKKMTIFVVEITKSQKMKRLFNTRKIILVCLSVIALYSCTENVDTSARYVFREETVASYLEKHADYSEYVDLLKKVKISRMSNSSVYQLMSARGNYTVFAPTNEAIQNYLEELVEQELISSPSWDAFTDSVKLDSVRKVVVYNSIIDGGDNSDQMYEVANFPVINNAEFPIGNLNDQKLTIYWLDNEPDSLFINGDCPIDVNNRDIPAINGYVHQLHKVIAPRNVTAAVYLQEILDTQKEGLLVMARCLQAAGQLDTLDVFRDEVYEELYQTGQVPDLIGMTKYGFAEGSIAYAPKHRLIGFTIFAEPDSFWREQGIDPTDPDLLQKLVQWILDNHQYSDDDDFVTDTDYENPKNLLYQWTTYHMLPMKLAADKLVIHNNEFGYNTSNPYNYAIPVYEYYTTMGERRLLKLIETKASNGVCLNRFPNIDDAREGTGLEISCDPDKVGCLIDREGELAITNDIINCCIYPIDAPLSYSDEVRDNLAKERIRFDGMSLFPEAMTNDIRKKAATEERYQHVHIPKNSVYQYFKNFSINDDCNFVYYNAYQYDWCNLNADEMKAVGRYELMFTLPPVPRRGTYEFRYKVLANGNRGVAQIYFGSDPNNLPVAGIPLDLTITCNDRRVPWEADSEDEDYNAEVDKRMRNSGIMKGVRSIKKSNGTERSTVNNECLRRILWRGTLDPHETYYFKMKSVLDSDKKEFYMDYLEYCPKEVYDNPEQPENIW